MPVLVAVVGLLLVQRLVPQDRREEQNDVAGFIYAVLGVAYAVLLAFMLIAVWQDYNTAQTNVESEAHELAGVYFLASQLPKPERSRLQDLARTYAKVVVKEEWPMMERGKTSPRADSLLRQLRLKPAGVRSSHQRRAGALRTWADAGSQCGRRQEVTAAGGQGGRSNLLWVVLVVGGVITVSFTYLFGLRTTWRTRLWSLP